MEPIGWRIQGAEEEEASIWGQPQIKKRFLSTGRLGLKPAGRTLFFLSFIKKKCVPFPPSF